MLTHNTGLDERCLGSRVWMKGLSSQPIKMRVRRWFMKERVWRIAQSDLGCESLYPKIDSLWTVERIGGPKERRIDEGETR